jgi:metallo-beta-lactamase family protein
MLKITCLGGTGSVSGSCFLVESPSGKKMLVDCGLFQGGKQTESRNWEDWGFAPKDIQTLFLTHAHIDHSGRIPKLCRDGFKGQIITSPPTAQLCEIMLLDSAHIQEMDAEWQTRKNKRQTKSDVLPLYTTQDAEASLRLFYPVERDQIIDICEGVRARLRNAGHILGSSILELWVDEGGKTLKTVFSGDLGQKNQLIVRNPHGIFDADYLFIESTYGNRLHRSFEDSTNELLEAINYSVSHGEKIIIPAFAVERTQEIIYILGEFHRKGVLPDIPVYLDSPLAIKATEIFRKNKKYYDKEAQAIVDEGYDPFDMPNLRFTLNTRDSIAINEQPGSAIIISANGMCTAGRIKHHLKHNLWRKGASLVIVGFQAEGTTGRRIVDGAKKVKIFREDVSVRAKVFTIGGFSAHADQKGIIEWVSHFESNPRVFTIHGESVSCKTLAQKINKKPGFEVYVPKWKETLLLGPREVAFQKPAAEKALPDLNTILLRTLEDIEKDMSILKAHIKTGTLTEKLAEDDIDRLKYIQEEIQAFL